MSTRSIIAMKDGDKFKTIYCHYDGYPEHQYPILIQNYNTYEKIRELFEHGSLSLLEETIDKCIFNVRDEKEDYDENCELVYDSYNELIRCSKGFMDFFYYWDGEKWFYC